MLLLLALLGCNPEASVTTPPEVYPDGPEATHTSAHAIATRRSGAPVATRAVPPPPPMPPGEAVYTDCGAGPWPPRPAGRWYDGDEDRSEEQTRGPAKPTTTAPAYRPQPKPAPSPAAGPSPAPSPSPTPQAGSGRSGGEGSLLIIRGGTEREARSADSTVAVGGAVAPGPSATPVSEPVVAEPPPAAPTADAPILRRVAPKGATGAGEAAADGYAGTPKDVAGNTAREKAQDKRDQVTAELKPIEEEEPTLGDDERANDAAWNWGATVHLSNDDSMSLASAQRVLFQVMNKRRPNVSEIRPHELLNYFSFDTIPVPDNELFSVLGSAEADGDTLSVALAVQGGVPVRQPLDLTLSIDRSGSMAAEGRVAYTARGLDRMVEQLRPGDRIDLVWFESRVCTSLTDYVVGRDDPDLLRHALSALRPMGSTDLAGGLKEAYRIQRGRSAADTHGRNRRVMLITDAFLNTGSVDPDVVATIGTAFDESNIRLTGVGVGRDFNDEVLDKLTEKGKGAYVYLGSEAVVDRVFGAGFDSLVRTIAHDVRFSLDLPDSLAMSRFYGEEASTNAADIQPIHYYAGTSQVFLQDLKIRGELVPNDPITMRISWRDAVTGEPDALELRTTVGALVDGERRNLHKAQALMAWSDWTLAWAMGGDPCGPPMDTYGEKAGRVGDDAELGFLSGLVQGVCGRPVVAATPGVAYKVRVDSDIPIAEVGLACGGKSWSEAIGGGDTVARFDAARPGACTLTLHGNVAMQTPVEVPATGGDLRCTVRGGRMSCS